MIVEVRIIGVIKVGLLLGLRLLIWKWGKEIVMLMGLGMCSMLGDLQG